MQPFLFVFILVGGGILAAIAVRLTDSAIIGDEASWKAEGKRSVFGITRLSP